MLKIPVLAIFRGIKIKHVQDIVQCCIQAGIDTVEVTMNTESVTELIKAFKDYGHDKLTVGAGTVLTMNQLGLALEAGAEFIVTPAVNPEIIDNCVVNRIPVFPGALTPTEVWTAWEHGAEMVKIFPANTFGPGYFRLLKGPFNNIKLMAVGGINDSNISEYLVNGASAVAVGGSIFSSDRLEKGQYDLIKNDLKKLVSLYLIFNENNRSN